MWHSYLVEYISLYYPYTSQPNYLSLLAVTKIIFIANMHQEGREVKEGKLLGSIEIFIFFVSNYFDLLKFPSFVFVCVFVKETILSWNEELICHGVNITQ